MPMRWAVLFLFLLLLATPSAWSDVAVVNGTFDAWDTAGAQPEGWTIYSESKRHSTVSRRTDEAGNVVALIHLPQSDFVQLQQYLSAKAGARYRVSFRARGAFEGVLAFSTELAAGGGPFTLGDNWQFASPWRNYTFDVTVGTKDALGLGLRLRGKGAVWIDDVTLTTLSSSPQPAVAEALVVMPSIFSDHMVLQRDRDIRVWGWAPPGVAVTVRLAGNEAAAVADGQSWWTVTLPAMPAGGPHELIITAGSAAPLTFTDVLIGDVWVCAGQSNMQHPMNQVIDAEKEIAAADHPRIRLVTIPMRLAGTPREDALHAGWSVCSPQTIPSFSAVAYYFGREIQQKTAAPVGLVNCAWFGTSIVGWTSERAYRAGDPAIRAHFDQFVARVGGEYPDWRQRMGDYHRLNGEDQNAYYIRMAAWKQAADPSQPEPAKPLTRPFHDSSPTGIYNAMVHPLTGMPIKGVIWYQGESDARRSSEYDDHLALMVSDWRSAWGQGDFPFLFVQIAWCKWWGTPFWAYQCEAQLHASRTIPNSAMVVINDLHDNYDQHPRLKRGVGERLALAARNVAYGEKDVVYQGPLYRDMTVVDGKAVLHFDHTQGKLIAATPDALSGLRIAGEDRVFHSAEAGIEGDTIVARSAKVTRPVAVRFNWGIDQPVCALFNGASLPMPPFRTDDWPLP